ncbi:MAG: putative tricarboxylic transport rane protein [Thermosediminibacterales bacterium]|nr:putative tricarboxylic transport rane protein [Thermosediminibacterales bacterium]
MSDFLKYIAAALLAILLSIIFYIKTFSLPPEGYQFPRLLIAVVILLSIAMVIEAYFKLIKNAKKNVKTEKNKTEKNVNSLRVFIFGLLIGLYVFTIKPVGYFIVTPLYLAVVYLYLKSTSIRNIVLISLGFTIFVYLLFVKFLHLPIPMGFFS